MCLCVFVCVRELVLALLVEPVDEAVGLALERPPEGDAAPATQFLRLLHEALHLLGQTHKLRRAQALERTILRDGDKTQAHREPN